MRDGAVSRTRCGWTGPTGSDRGALGAHEVAVVVDPAAIAVGVELAVQQHERVLAMGPPVGEERLEGPLLGHRQVGPVLVGGLEQDIEVTHGAEPARDLAEAVAEPLGPGRPE